jgi:hypothetical protein
MTTITLPVCWAKETNAKEVLQIGAKENIFHNCLPVVAVSSWRRWCFNSTHQSPLSHRQGGSPSRRTAREIRWVAGCNVLPWTTMGTWCSRPSLKFPPQNYGRRFLRLHVQPVYLLQILLHGPWPDNQVDYPENTRRSIRFYLKSFQIGFVMVKNGTRHS